MIDPLPAPLSSPLDTVLEAARSALEKRRAAAYERTRRLRHAVEAYLAAAEGELAAEFAAKIGVPYDNVATTRQKARALLDEVNTLPELREEEPSEATLPVVAPIALVEAPRALRPVPHEIAPGASLRVVQSPAEPGPPALAPKAPPVLRAVPEALAPPPVREELPYRAPRLEIAPEVRPPAPPSSPAAVGPVRPVISEVRDFTEQRNLEQAASALLETVRGLNFQSMPVGLFRVWAEELAAEARHLQDRGYDRDATGHVIRLLTRCAYDKGVRDVRGLNHRETGDWGQIAERARARRLLRQGNGPRPLTQRQDAEATRPTPAEGTPAALAPAPAPTPAPVPVAAPPPAPEPVVEEEEEVEVAKPTAELPFLRAATEHGPVVLIGGIVKLEKVELIRQRFGLEIEWVDTSRTGTGTVSTLEKRVRENRLAALVVLEGLLGHKHFEPLIAAARQVGLPHAYGGRAGAGSLLRAFKEIEGILNKQGSQGS